MAKIFTKGSVKIKANMAIKVQIISTIFIKLLVYLMAFFSPFSNFILLYIGIYPAYKPVPIKEKITLGIVRDIKKAS